MTFVLVAGTTETATIPGISAAGADPEAMASTPTADAEILLSGEPTSVPQVPVSPSGCPTPALVSRAIRDLLEFDVTVIDAGLSVSPDVATIRTAERSGGDVRTETPVPDADVIWERARKFGRDLTDSRLVVGESIPGGTTTALGVARALGIDLAVSSSLPENPIETKRSAVRDGLDASGIDSGALAGRPTAVVRSQGDPVLASVAGLVEGSLVTGTSVTLAGGTQLLTAAALLRHAGVEAPIEVAMTSYVAEDPSASVRDAAAALDVELTVTDPGFESNEHAGLGRFAAGEGKEGVGMGGALAMARREGVSMARVRERTATLYDRLVGDR